MSETRKVHLFAVLPALDEPDERSRHSREAVCGRWTATKVATFVGLAYPQHVAARMATPPTWRWLPQESMCAHCARVVPSAVRRDHILSVSLFLAGLSGWLPAAARDLVALVCVDPAAVPVLLDLAEDHASGWARCKVEWPTRDAHGTGDNPHVWFEAVGIAGPNPIVRKCPCGVYEHESTRSDIMRNAFEAQGLPASLMTQPQLREFRREYLGQWVPHGRCPDCGAPMNAATSQSRAECSDAACRRVRRRDEEIEMQDRVRRLGLSIITTPRLPFDID